MRDKSAKYSELKANVEGVISVQSSKLAPRAMRLKVDLNAGCSICSMSMLSAKGVMNSKFELSIECAMCSKYELRIEEAICSQLEFRAEGVLCSKLELSV